MPRWILNAKMNTSYTHGAPPVCRKWTWNLLLLIKPCISYYWGGGHDKTGWAYFYWLKCLSILSTQGLFIKTLKKPSIWIQAIKMKIGAIKMKIVGKKFYTTFYLNFVSHPPDGIKSDSFRFIMQVLLIIKFPSVYFM